MIPFFQHEYGHYLQSQEMGWGYYNRVGIPSIRSIEGRHRHHPVEQDANRRAFIYFNHHVEGFYRSLDDVQSGMHGGWDFQENPLGLRLDNSNWGEFWDYNNKRHMETLFQGFTVRAKWFDYPF